jgi:hypothetical protein
MQQTSPSWSRLWDVGISQDTYFTVVLRSPYSSQGYLDYHTGYLLYEATYNSAYQNVIAPMQTATGRW